MAKNNIIYIPCQTAIRSAFGNLGYSENIFQIAEEDLVRWTAEAQDLIWKQAGGYPMVEETKLTYNSQIRNSPDFEVLESIFIGNQNVRYNRNSRTTPYVRQGINWYGNNGNAENGNGYYEGHSFRITKEYITFSPNIADNTPVRIQYLVKPTDDDGYPMIISLCERAIAYYVGWKICVRERDDRKDDQYAQWLKACKQSRHDINEFTNEEIQSLGAAYMGVRNRRRWWGNYYW
jgi:hypothetical protein